MIALHAAFATAMRMVDRIHHNSANCRPFTHVPRSSCFSDSYVLMIEIAHLADGRNALDIHQSRLTRRQLDLRIAALFRNQLRCGSGASRHLCTLPGTKLDVVNGRSKGNVLQR